MRHILPGRSLGVGGPYTTTDEYFAGVLGVRQGSEQMLEAFSALPSTGPVAVVYVEDVGNGHFLACLTSYFAWPRNAHFIPVSPATVVREVESIDRSSFAAVFFCWVDPPAAMQPQIRIGSGLIMVPQSPEVRTQ